MRQQPALFEVPPEQALTSSQHPLAMHGERMFARHSDLPPRYGWLGKAYTALTQDPLVFAAPDACLRLGVGRAALTAIRYWMLAFHLADLGPDQGPGRPRPLLLTPQAHWLLHPTYGVDPYLEDNASLWLLHLWLLQQRPCRAPSWWVAFHASPIGLVKRAALERRIQIEAERAGWKAPTDDQVRHDVGCMIRMYSAREEASRRESVEDLLDRPFAGLGLIVSHEHRVHLPMNVGRRAPAELVLAACLHYAHDYRPEPGSMALARLAAEPGAPGRSLRLLRSDLVAKLRRALEGLDDVVLVDAEQEHASLAYRRPPAESAAKALTRLYAHAGDHPFPQGA
ncbi:DUF4007 family protein [Nonomuraea sp. NPDC049695]|uniref:DUF4007 family protein n=1 Tax=Nonomuraea sp. NPDC049695 TaxID=3154734 RepID=UPI00343D660C